MHKKILINEKIKWYFWGVFAPLFTVSCTVYIMKFIFSFVEGKIETFVCMSFTLIVALFISFLTPPELRFEAIKQFNKLQKLYFFGKNKL